jgi:hypothetical protein
MVVLFENLVIHNEWRVSDRGSISSLSTLLQSITVKPISFIVAKKTLIRHHYLHSLPGGTKLAFGVFIENHLLGAITFGAGPTNVHRLVDGASTGDCLTLSRLWLSDKLPRNSESLVLSAILRALKKYTTLKFIVTYADPSFGHVGTIYQATGWLYTGLSSSTPLYSIGGGNPRHSRSVGQVFGSRSVGYFASHGVDIKLIKQEPKHRYIFFLYPGWKECLTIPILPYPKRQQ